MFELNYWAILVAALAAMVIGGMWYGPLFGKVWMRLTGISQEKIDEIKKKGMAKSYILNFVGYLVMAYFLAYFVLGWSTSQPELNPVSIGLQTGFWLWLGLIATSSMSPVLWEGRSWKFWFLNNGYSLLKLLAMGAILGTWR